VPELNPGGPGAFDLRVALLLNLFLAFVQLDGALRGIAPEPFFALLMSTAVAAVLLVPWSAIVLDFDLKTLGLEREIVACRFELVAGVLGALVFGVELLGVERGLGFFQNVGRFEFVGGDDLEGHFSLVKRRILVATAFARLAAGLWG